MQASQRRLQRPGDVGAPVLLTSSEPGPVQSPVPAGRPHPELLSVSGAIYFSTLKKSYRKKNAFLSSFVHVFAFLFLSLLLDL